MVPYGGGGTAGYTNHPLGNFFKCGLTGHWASSCLVKGPRGQMQMMGHSQWCVPQKGMAFDMQGPPPSAYRYCGGQHLDQFCPTA